MSRLVLAPNIATLLEREPLDAAGRLRVAASWGAEVVEMWGWRTTDIDALSNAIADTSVGLAAMVVDPIVSLTDPGASADALDALSATVDIAHRLGCPTIVVPPGQTSDLDPMDRREQLLEVLAALADIAREQGVGLAFEALNSRPDHPHVAVDRLADAMDLAERVGSPSLGVAVDVYHSHRMGESLLDAIDGRFHLVRHVQVAGPDRDEPGAGTSPWMPALRAILAGGYVGPIGLEYRTPAPPGASFAHVAAFLRDALAVDDVAALP